MAGDELVALFFQSNSDGGWPGSGSNSPEEISAVLTTSGGCRFLPPGTDTSKAET